MRSPSRPGAPLSRRPGPTRPDLGLRAGPVGDARSLGVFLRGEARVRGTPRWPGARPRPSRPRGPHEGCATAPLTGSRHLGSAPDLGRPSLPTRPPTGLAPSARSRLVGRGAQAGDREPSRRPGWGAGRSGRASGRGEGGRPLSAPGRVNALHLGPHSARGPSLRPLDPAPPASALSAGRVGPPRSPVGAQAAAGACGGWGPARGRGLGPAGPSLVNILFC